MKNVENILDTFNARIDRAVKATFSEVFTFTLASRKINIDLCLNRIIITRASPFTIQFS